MGSQFQSDSDKNTGEMPIDEAGSIGEEQCPEDFETKTDKVGWSYAADKIKELKLPQGLREFLNGL
jgi:hypothetical protein